jgi:hypothetical protein
LNFRSTAEFYRSKEWADCKAQVLHDRLAKSKDGVIYCDLCHKPIVSAFNPSEKNNRGAIVFHHVIFLTNQNVNDASISINPENIQVLHWRCHNAIHQRFGFGGVPEKKVYLVTGAPCSGKSTYVRERAEGGDVVLDIDDLWEAVSGLPRYQKPKALSPIVFSLRDNLRDMIARGVGSWRNAFVIGSLPSPVDRDREADRYRAFNVEVVTMETSEAECLDRLNREPKGRDKKEYEKFIREYFQRFRE